MLVVLLNNKHPRLKPQVGGGDRGAQVALAPQIRKLLRNQIKMGGLKDGDFAFVKLASDGTAITRKQTATVSTVTIGNETKALQIGTIAIVLAGETYEVMLFICYSLIAKTLHKAMSVGLLVRWSRVSQKTQIQKNWCHFLNN